MMLAGCSSGSSGDGSPIIFVRYKDGSGCDATSGSGSRQCVMTLDAFKAQDANDKEFHDFVRSYNFR